MPKIEDGTAATGTFRIDGIPFQKGGYELKIKGNNIGINRMNARDISSSILETPVDFSDWTDDGDAAYASIAAFIADVETFFYQP